jgi:hypothetical protein
VKYKAADLDSVIVNWPREVAQTLSLQKVVNQMLFGGNSPESD